MQLSEGNAFYLEELIRAAAEAQRSDHPETVVAMVQARLDALDDDARRILRAASVLGEVFWAGAVAQLLGGAGTPAGLGPAARGAGARELIVLRTQSRFPDEAEYAFRHALLREGAYASLTDEDRALGHRLAGRMAGRSTASRIRLALAEHFERGGDGARATLNQASQTITSLDAPVGRAARGGRVRGLPRRGCERKPRRYAGLTWPDRRSRTRRAGWSRGPRALRSRS